MKGAKTVGKYLTTFAIVGMMALSNPMEAGALGPRGTMHFNESEVIDSPEIMQEWLDHGWTVVILGFRNAELMRIEPGTNVVGLSFEDLYQQFCRRVELGLRTATFRESALIYNPGVVQERLNAGLTVVIWGHGEELMRIYPGTYLADLGFENFRSIDGKMVKITTDDGQVFTGICTDYMSRLDNPDGVASICIGSIELYEMVNENEKNKPNKWWISKPSKSAQVYSIPSSSRFLSLSTLL